MKFTVFSRSVLNSRRLFCFGFLVALLILLVIAAAMRPLAHHVTAASIWAGETITVNTLEDVSDFSGPQTVANLPGPDGRISFREATVAANNTPGPQTIAFAIPVSQFWLLTDVALLKVEDGAFFLNDNATTVDFSTQTVNIGDTNPSGPEVGFYGLEPNAWGVAAIYVNGDNCVIKGAGKVYQRGYAARIVGNNNRVIGSSIEGGLHGAIHIAGYVGAPPPTGNIIGGTAPGEGNRLSSVVINGPADGNIVIGNVVIGGGVRVEGATRYGVIVTNTRIGGPTASERNVISGAGRYGEEGFPLGAQVAVVDADGTTVEGNYIGTTVDGMTRYQPQIGPIGIEIYDSRGTTVRGNLVAGQRTIGQNHYAGQIFGQAIRVGATNENNLDTLIEGNTVGLAADGVTPIVTRAGIAVTPLIASRHAFETRLISNHIGHVETIGVAIGSQENGVLISRNLIHDSGALGIDLFSGFFNGTAGVTPNDPGDTDTGANGLQNFPVLTSAAVSGTDVVIQGTLDTVPSEPFVLEFFGNGSCDPSGHGEGAAFLGSTTVTTDADGHTGFTATLPAAGTGSVITSTATRAATSDTSEFSACRAVSGGGTTPTPTSTPTVTPSPTPPAAFEADVAPRPAGDGMAMATDIAQLRRFAAGLDVPAPGSDEQERADCAPRATLGDGLINAGDVIQGRRYSTGLDPMTTTGGTVQTAASGMEISLPISEIWVDRPSRSIRVGSVAARGGSTVIVPIDVSGRGDEVGVSFTMEYDSRTLLDPKVAVGDIGDGVLTVNLLEGRLGIVLDWEKPIRGSGHILYVTFEVAKGASGRMPLTLTDSVAARAISDRQGETQPTNWIGGVVVVRDRGLDRR